MKERPESATRSLSVPVKVALLYALLAMAWIGSSDQILALVSQDPLVLTRLQTYKGLLFVAVTTMLLFVIVYRQFRTITTSNDRLRESELATTRLSRLHRMRSGINSAGARMANRDDFLDEVCRVAVQDADFAFCWIGMLDRRTLSARATAWYGPYGGFLNKHRVSASDAIPAGHTPEGRALRDKQPVVCNNIGTDADAAGWRERALSFGFRSVAAFPLVHDDKSIGVLVLYAMTPDAFDEHETRLLKDVTADIVLGLKYFRNTDRLNYAVYYDAQTDLPNRALFLARVGHAARTDPRAGRCSAVLVLEVQGYQEVLDALGHAAADRVLWATARYLSRHVRTGDTVGRVGGCQFGVLLANMASPNDVMQVVENLLSGFPLRFKYTGEHLSVNVRGGVAVSSTDGASPSELLKHATVALNGAHGRRVNTCSYFADDMDKQARRKHALAQGLSTAFDEDELYLVFQPFVATDSKQVVGMEALARWENRRLGSVPPSEFVPVLEHMGFSEQLGRWSLDQTCRQLRHWCSEGGCPLRVSINISAEQLLAPNFLRQMEEVVEKSGNDDIVQGMALEITETAIVHDYRKAVEVLSEVRKAGVSVYLDDFGTGYSSLSHLSRLPLDHVKIDSSFIRAVPHSANARALIRGVVSLARSLGLGVIAEGVEDEQQCQVVQELGCNVVQGFLFGRPGRAEEVTPLLATPRG